MAGPVGPAGGMGHINRTRIMQTCTMDGTLLKPVAPARQLDSTYLALFTHSAGTNGENGKQRISADNNFIGIESVWGTTMGMGTVATMGDVRVSASPPSSSSSPSSSPALSSPASSSPAPSPVPSSIHHLILFANISSLEGFNVTAGELGSIEQQQRQEERNRRGGKGWRGGGGGEGGTAVGGGQLDKKQRQGVSPLSYVAREYYSGELRVVDATRPLHGKHFPRRPASCANGGFDLDLYCVNFELWTVAPVDGEGGGEGGRGGDGGKGGGDGGEDGGRGVGGHGYGGGGGGGGGGRVLLGEVDKYVGISRERFQQTSLKGRIQGRIQGRGEASTVATLVAGSAGELVSVGMMDCRGGVCAAGAPSEGLASRFSVVACTIPSSGSATLRCAGSGGCTCR